MWRAVLDVRAEGSGAALVSGGLPLRLARSHTRSGVARAVDGEWDGRPPCRTVPRAEADSGRLWVDSGRLAPSRHTRSDVPQVVDGAWDGVIGCVVGPGRA
ncbi:hypothetical protein GCM10010472_28240 [Pseudonocardia halophobica]|uniref:Uncharacterized protein n=1 Tax=Pseudonocardia halophobica TaxID=29401 RepID=A0A9W6KWQ3_9PSEU|nr:hypothetical protein GCM10017577_02230 [Pseudonocardia halophobica]